MNPQELTPLAHAHADLVRFAQEQDFDFYSFQKDATSLTVASKRYVATLRHAETGQPRRLYNSNELSFDAEYAIEGTERANTLRSIIVRLGVVSVRQLAEVPHMLLPSIEPAIVDSCNQAAAGALSEQRSVEFMIRNHHGNTSHVSGMRQVDYTLLNDGAVIHQAHYPTPGTELPRQSDMTEEDLAFYHLFTASTSSLVEARAAADQEIAQSAQRLLRYLRPGRLSLPEPDGSLDSNPSELAQ